MEVGGVEPSTFVFVLAGQNVIALVRGMFDPAAHDLSRPLKAGNARPFCALAPCRRPPDLLSWRENYSRNVADDLARRCLWVMRATGQLCR